tara:strand:+ start:1127 stop:2389 length:1263 start_codon:yes stop_codon:yes gene_type:complete
MKKKVLIYGMGVTGVELRKFCRKKRISYITFDDNSVSKTKYEFKDLLKNCEEIIVSPGIGLRNKNIKLAIKSGKKILSEIEFASRYIKTPIVAITGTNGKTTTTMLTYELLKSLGYKVFLGGNIGKPLISYLLEKQNRDLILVEVSSFQLQFIQSSFKPLISAFLNISENHLDHHANMKEYIGSKMKIFNNQDKDCFAVCSKDIYKNITKNNFPIFCNPTRNENLKILKNGLLVGKKYRLDIKDIQLIGKHNLTNIAFAITICSILKELGAKELNILKKFKPLNHRLEIVKKNRRGIIINDSKSTSPEATQVAINSLDGKSVLIMGGKDKKLDYSLIRNSVKTKINTLILFGENKFELAKTFDTKVKIIAADLFDAVLQGLKSSAKGGTLLFSPGTSSFDQFKSYSERGDKFKEYVKKLY